MKDKCKTCGKDKEEKYKRNAYCKECTIKRTKEWRLKHPGYSKGRWEKAKKREIKNEFCRVCGKLKEEKLIHTSYCSKCASNKAREWELKNKDKKQASIKKRKIIRQTSKCKECGIEFLRLRGEKVCSIKCKLLNEKTINDKGCWIAPRTGSRGYGQISFRGMKNKLAHRISYSEFKGEIPKGLFVCHQCDNPACYNPDHLFLGTAKDNVHDGIQKGRIKHVGAKGRNCKFTNLTEEQIDEMRKLFSEGINLARLARIFKCNKDYASKIVRNKVRNS